MGLFKNLKDGMDTARQMQEQAAAQLGGQGGFGAMPGANGMDGAAAATMSDAATLNASGAEMRRLWAEGLDGMAIIRSFDDTGERLAGNTVLDLHMIVTIAGGEPFPVTHRMPIAGSDTSPYAPGSEYTVKVDPENRQNLTFAPAA